MSKKIGFTILGIVAVITVSGCATGRDYQQDLNALNAKLSTLEGQISSKDEELMRLRSQMDETEAARRSALMQAENENRQLNERLNKTLAQLESAKAVKPVQKKQEESDLK